MMNNVPGTTSREAECMRRKTMSQTIQPIAYTHEPAPNTVRWTRQQCRAMQESGILAGRYELIEGEIILKMGQKRPRALVIMQLTVWLFSLFGAAFVQVQLPIRVLGKDRDTSEPEPDAAVLTRPASDFLDETPEAMYVSLIIEVSDTTLRFDRNTKATLYARNGVPEYWVIDIEGRQIFSHRQPAPEGYTEVAVYSAGEELSTLARPDAPIAAADLLPPQPLP
jgi:Uma2 family endonuclease